MSGVRTISTLCLAVACFCGSVHATYIHDSWSPNGGGGAGERNVYQIYNHLFGTDFQSSNELVQLDDDTLFTLSDMDSWVVFLVSFAGFDQSFGWYQTDENGTVSMHPVFQGTPDQGDWFDLGSISGPFGLYGDTLSQGGMIAYSDATLNSDQRDHMVALSTPYADLFLLAFEDVPANHPQEDFDYNDMVIAVRGISVVPEPATFVMLGLGIAGLAVHRLRGSSTVNS
ncbi:MAG: hypothetical protein AMXMBFR84_10680 [Candidatus Hydrogenedentota bacterium]